MPMCMGGKGTVLYCTALHPYPVLCAPVVLLCTQYPYTLLPRNFAESFFLTGQIPESLGNCIKLEVLKLHSNKLQGKCSIRLHFCLEILLNPFFLKGQIPESLGNCTKLTQLCLDGNQLTGKCMIRATDRPQISLIHFF